ncbi:MAG TPA: LLM class flavin-dependent oxidoreductase [Streptosporangiaceae bacterium]|nr:LLM class flavin-dependent oxidoreductase [Streptosporangiaceae bacterium]
MTTRLGVQLTPSAASGELVALGKRLSESFDLIWVQDQMLARNVYALLGAIAHAGCGVGTNVTYPAGRNPIEMASALATVGELVPAGRDLVVGIGTGGALVNSLFRKEHPVTVVRETIGLMRALWQGETVELDAYPVLGAACGYRPGATATLTYPVPRPPDILIAGVGPRILAVAGAHADGLICASNLPTLSLASLRSGRFGELSGLGRALAARPADLAPLRLVFGINVSVSRDRKLARAHARRQLALVVGNPRLWPDLAAVGLDTDSAGEVKEAFDAGLGIEGAAARMSDSLADALIVAGTPEDCAGQVTKLRDLALAEGYQEFYLGAPLGPDPREAAELLVTELVPEVWPERGSSR